jgi:hypothetical protein
MPARSLNLRMTSTQPDHDLVATDPDDEVWQKALSALRFYRDTRGLGTTAPNAHVLEEPVCLRDSSSVPSSKTDQ